MRKLVSSLSVLLLLSSVASAIELGGLEPIAPVVSYVASASAIVFTCDDGSQVQVSVLAPDLVRVRASFGTPIPDRDHSWAIAKTEWETPRWSVKEESGTVIIVTDELEVAVRRSPLLIDFRDAKTHRLVNADFAPMMHGPGGSTVTAAKRLGFDEHFYGLGEKAARLDKRRGRFTMWNSDTPFYTEGTDPIYQTIPFYIGWEGGEAYGIFFDNSYRTHFDFGSSSQEYAAFSADGGEMNYYFFWGPSMKKILGRYTELTGRAPLPPMWALGNQQSRWSYYPDTVAEEVVRQYRAHDLPLDVLYLDIHYMQGYRVFTFDTSRFPDPKGFTDRLSREGVKVVTIVDPGVKRQPPASGATDASESPELAPQEKSYYVYNQGLAQDLFLKRKSGSVFVGRVWPGESVLVDYTLESGRRWWGDLHRAYLDNGIAGIWTDMNEPSDFVDQSGNAQMDVVSYDEGEFSTHAKNRNVFGLLMARATYEGLLRLRPDTRPYVITRAGYAGYQRYSTMWTGDNTATWDALKLSIPMFQTLGLSGVSFVGGDVGGFSGRTNGELLTRWYEVGFLTPMCRNHMDIQAYDHEPWRFGTYYEGIIRKYLKLRYRLLPFIYTVVEESSRTGVPVFRPLLLNYQADPNALTIDDEFMIGSDLLVAPVLEANATGRLVYLPEGTWYDYWTTRKIAGGTMLYADAPLDVVPMFVRAGAVIPMGPEMNYVGERPSDPITFEIYADDGTPGAATLYEDDGVSLAHERGVWRRTMITASSGGGAVEIELSAPEGSYTPAPRSFVLEVKSLSSAREVLVDGTPLARLGADESRPGWYISGGQVAVRIADDGRGHRVRIQ